MPENDHIKHLDTGLTAAVNHLKTELAGIRSNRPSIEIVENITAIYYDQPMAINQLGSLSIQPPRTILINLWDKEAVAPVMSAIQNANVGLSLSNEGNTIRATVTALSGERREELARLVKKHAESTRITIRTHRDDVMKALKTGKEKKELTEDQEFTFREAAQKRVEKANAEVETLVENKLASISE